MKTTPAQYNRFKRNVEAWLKEFGLTGWNVVFRHGGLDDKCVRAQTEYDMENRQAEFKFNKEHDVAGSRNEIEDVQELALHETLKLLPTEMEEIGLRRTYDEYHMSAASHAVIYRLIRFIKRTNAWPNHDKRVRRKD